MPWKHCCRRVLVSWLVSSCPLTLCPNTLSLQTDRWQQMQVIVFACSAILPLLGESSFFFFLFFFIAPLSVWAVAGPGQLCHILSTAGTHFLFPFWINLLTSFTAFTYKNPPTVLPDRCGSNRKDKVRDNGPRADALTSCLFHFLGSFWISSRLYLLGLFVFFLEEYIKRINRLLFYIWHPSTWRCCSWSGSL